MRVTSLLRPCVAFLLLAVASCGSPTNVHVEVRNEDTEPNRFLVGFTSLDEDGHRHHTPFLEGQLIDSSGSRTASAEGPSIPGAEIIFFFAVYDEHSVRIEDTEPLIALAPIIEQLPENGTYQFVLTRDPDTEGFKVSHGWRPEHP